MLDIEEIVDFFEDLTERKIPFDMMRIIRSSDVVRYGDLVTTWVELERLREYSPEIANKIKTEFNINIPLIHRINDPVNFVYDPVSREYLGKFEIK